MNKFFCIFIFYLFSQSLHAQIQKPIRKELDNRTSNDTTRVDRKSTTNKNIKDEKATIDLYKIISYERDTTFLDTTLSIKKEYKYNYLRKDNFNLISFSNVGQTYNTLSFDSKNKSTIPLFGVRAKHFNYMEIEDINYFQAPTPLTELMYKTAFEQGQLLDAFFTTNITKQFNLYK